MSVIWQPGMRCIWTKGRKQANWLPQFREYIRKGRVYVVAAVHPAEDGGEHAYLSFVDGPWNPAKFGPAQFDSRAFETFGSAAVIAWRPREASQ